MFKRISVRGYTPYKVSGAIAAYKTDGLPPVVVAHGDKEGKLSVKEPLPKGTTVICCYPARVKASPEYKHLNVLGDWDAVTIGKRTRDYVYYADSTVIKEEVAKDEWKSFFQSYFD